MKLQDLKELSSKRIINMARLYEKAGISVSSMNSRLSTLSGSLSLEEQNALELAAVQHIEEVVDTLNIDKTHLANALDMPPPNQGQAKKVIPIGYLRTTADILPVYLEKDKICSRTAKSGVGDPLFWTVDRFAEAVVKNPKLEPTDRGRKLFEETEQ